MNIGTLNPAEKKNFISFFLFFFFYYFIMSAYFPFFPVWLADVNHLTKTETGIVFSCVAFFGILFQFLFGYITDKLGLRKHLLWVIVAGLVCFAPFFLLVFKPLLAESIYLGGVVGGIYLDLSFPAGPARWTPILRRSAAPIISNTAKCAPPAVLAGRFAPR